MRGHLSGLAKVLAPALPMLVAAACDTGSGPGDDVPMTLSFMVEPRSGLAGVSAAMSSTPALSHGATTLVLTEVELGVEELVLEHDDVDGGDSEGDSDSDSDSDGAANEPFVVDGVTVVLPLDGDVLTPFSETVPAGLYEELELDIETVHLVGTVEGEAFDVTVPVDMELEIEFDPPLEVVEGDEPFNVTIVIDPLAWLEHDDGSFLDPRDLDGSDLNLFRQRMALTFEAFEDSDQDGDEQDSDSDSEN